MTSFQLKDLQSSLSGSSCCIRQLSSDFPSGTSSINILSFPKSQKSLQRNLVLSAAVMADKDTSGSISRSTVVLDSSTVPHKIRKATNIFWHESKVTKQDRQKLNKQRGCVVWMTGLSGSGKSTLAYTLDNTLTAMGKMSYVLDGDNVRHGLNKNLGFSPEDREENIRRVGEVAKLFCDANLITLVSFISPYEKDRLQARALFDDDEFIEVYMKIPLAVCEQRDPKGLYKLARAGKIKGFTGIDDPYEEPQNPEIVMEVSKEDGNLMAPDDMADAIINYLHEKGFLHLNE